MNLGDFKEDGDLFFKFTTRRFSTGATHTLANTPVLSVYIDEGTSPKTTAEAYFDLDVDFNSKTGLNNVRIDLSGDAFFATGADYSVVITTGTVDSVSVVGEVVATFSIENRSMGKPVGATLSDDIAAIKAETVLIVEDTDLIDDGTSGLAKIATDVAATLVDTAVIGALGVGLSNIPWNASWDAEVQSEVNDALVAVRLDELLAADSDIDGAAPPTVGSVFHELLSKTAGSFTFDQTTDSLEAVRDNQAASAPTAGAVADQVWNEAQADHVAGGSFGEIATEIAAIPTTAMRGTDGALTDKAGFSLSTAGILAIWHQLTAAIVTASTIGKLFKDNINATISSRHASGAAVASVSGNVDGSVGSVTGAVGSVAGNVDGNVTGSIGSLAAQAKTDVLAEINTALNTTVAELAQGVPAKNPTIRTGMMLMYMALRNKLDVATVATDTLEVHNDAGTRIAQKLLTDDGADYSEAKMTSGA